MSAKRMAGVGIGLALLVVPAIGLAQVGNGTSPPPVGNITTPPPVGNSTSPSCPPGAFCFENPLNFSTFCGLLKGIFNAILTLGIPIAVLFIVWAGFKLVLARGNTTALATAKLNLVYILVGIAIFLGAWMLSQIIANTVNALGATNARICN